MGHRLSDDRELRGHWQSRSSIDGNDVRTSDTTSTWRPISF